MARGSTPLGFGAPSLDTSYQSQIDDLVQRNRTLEHTNKKLADQIALEKAIASEALAEAQKHWRQEQVEWRQGCDVLQSCHRVVQLRNIMQLEEERMNVLREQDVTRKEKLLRLQRDFRITMFQAREAELEDKIRDLEEDRDYLFADWEEASRQHEQQIADYVAKLGVKVEEISAYEEEKAELQDTLAKLREKHARLEGNGEKNVRELERVTLQRDGLITARDELQRHNDELTRSKADLGRQLEKWQNLENKNEAEVEAERQKRVKLDIQVQELETQLEMSAEEHEKQLRKEKRKVEKLKEAYEELQVAAEKHDEEMEAESAKLAKAQRKISRLQAALEAERTRTRSPSPSNSIDENDAQPPLSPEPPIKPKPRRTQNKPPSKLQVRETANAEAGPSGTNNGETEGPTRKKKRKAAESDVEEVSKPKSKPSRREERGEEIEEVFQKQKSKGKGKAKAAEVTDDIVEIAPPSKTPPKTRRTTKRKAEDDEKSQLNDGVEPAKTKASLPSDSRGETEAAMNTQRKPLSRMRSASVRPSRDEETSDAEKEPAKKKRRKINIFSSSAVPFTFEAIGGTSSGLNIPTVLSPVKESDNVPSRSTSGSMVGTISSMLKSSFTTQR
ncbi:hypothetical protein H2248_008401 [Termitomyces sp. 'cryptogamus']|nr:hypothetical protein H2248_008401 [Termitomyces sp. 'cryptogamus']